MKRLMILVGVFCLMTSFFSGMSAEGRTDAIGSDNTTSLPILSTATPVTNYLPLVMSRYRDVPGDYRDCRLGVGVVRNPISTYDFTLFKIGWYVDWRATRSPIKPYGMEFYQTIRVKQNKSGGVYLSTYTITPPLDFSSTGLGPMVQANPGNTWLIGNEIDRVNIQDETLPDTYAQIYHDAYYFIKGIDPTARVAIGSIVQPTPVRLQYLDLVLDAYQTKFGEPMPVDVWNIHIYILREVKNSWGGEIPPGVDATTGMLYTVRDHVDLEILKSQVIAMRDWMKQRGYQDRPLIVTEFGALFPLWFLQGAGVTEAEAFEFNRNAINYLATAADPNLGYPADNYRLVQQAALYSLDDDSLMTIDDEGTLDYKWGTFLFYSTAPYAVTRMGEYYRDNIASAFTASVDLFPYRAATDPSPIIVTGSEPITPVVKVSVANAGNSRPLQTTTVRLVDETGGTDNLIGEVLLPPFTGCGTLQEVRIPWPNPSVGFHALRIEVDPDRVIADSERSNNALRTSIFVGTHAMYLPLIRRR